jgi:formate dehydrogenase iron-sulfur subunit
MSLRLYVPRDTTALSLGADQVATALAGAAARRGLAVELVRNGSRGAFWLEPLVEAEIDGRRVAFGPLAEAEAESLLDALSGATEAHPRYLGPVEQIAWLSEQRRLTFARAGQGDPLCLDSYLALGGYAGLRRALQLTPQQIIDEVRESGLRGRGGAAFPAGIKWQTVLDTPARQKYIVCNADEGDSGTFADRLLLEADPYQLLEGMTIAALAVGATRGYIYLRSEYPRAHEILQEALSRARAAGWLGPAVCGGDSDFDIELRLGAGAYICGEETALLDSLEGRRGMVRAKPPLPAVSGLFGQPTLVNNVLTLAAVSSVLAEGAEQYAALGCGRSQGTLSVQLAGNVARGGLVELPFGVSLREVVERFGGGTRSGRPIRAIQVGGPLGAYLPREQWDTPLDYDAFAAIGALLGHGGVVVFDDTVDMAAQARFAMAFCAAESCGKCTPCRIGAVRGVEVIDRICAGEAVAQNRELLAELCDTMEHGSLCAMGGLTPLPVRSAMRHFAADFDRGPQLIGRTG